MGAVVACSTAAGVNVVCLWDRGVGFDNMDRHGCCIKCDAKWCALCRSFCVSMRSALALSLIERVRIRVEGY